MLIVERRLFREQCYSENFTEIVERGKEFGKTFFVTALVLETSERVSDDIQ